LLPSDLRACLGFPFFGRPSLPDGNLFYLAWKLFRDISVVWFPLFQLRRQHIVMAFRCSFGFPLPCPLHGNIDLFYSPGIVFESPPLGASLWRMPPRPFFPNCRSVLQNFEFFALIPSDFCGNHGALPSGWLSPLLLWKLCLDSAPPQMMKRPVSPPLILICRDLFLLRVPLLPSPYVPPARICLLHLALRKWMACSFFSQLLFSRDIFPLFSRPHFPSLCELARYPPPLKPLAD